MKQSRKAQDTEQKDPSIEQTESTEPKPEALRLRVRRLQKGLRTGVQGGSSDFGGYSSIWWY
jgi:hypothetical protein